MRTNFYQRTAYQLSDQPVPSCFVRLDDVFDRTFTVFEEADAHPCVVMAESLCARMADLEMYAFLMEDARKRHTVDARAEEKATILTRSFFVGYLGAGRAVMDVAAASLAALYGLPVDTQNSNFGSGDFWRHLAAVVPDVHRRYHPLRLFITEFLRWSNESAHRIPPLVAVHHHFGRYTPREQRLQMIDDPNISLTQMSSVPHTMRWTDPLQLHDRWKPQFMLLCEKVCLDLEKNLGAR